MAFLPEFPDFKGRPIWRPPFSRNRALPKIMIRCPIKGRAVPTGLTTEMVLFDLIPADLEMPLRCLACLKVHTWKAKDAWVDKADSTL